MKPIIFAILVTVVLSTLSIDVSANGRKPVGSVAVKATIETAKGPSQEIFNVRIFAGGKPSVAITGKEGDATVTFKLSNIKHIDIKEVDDSAKELTCKVRLEEEDGVHEISIPVSKDNPATIRGMLKDRAAFEIPLAKCKSIDFATQGSLHEAGEWPVRSNATKK